MTPLKSSTVESAMRDGDDLVVQFKSGGRYRYPGAARHFEKMIAAPSVGKYLHREVKPKFVGRKVACDVAS